jgi:hypothetical protein
MYPIISMIGHLHHQQQKWLVAYAIICTLNSEHLVILHPDFWKLTSNEEANRTGRDRSIERTAKTNLEFGGFICFEESNNNLLNIFC